MIFSFIATFSGVLAAFILKWFYDSYQNRKNRNRLCDSLREELENGKKRLDFEGRLLPNSIWLSAINSGYVMLLPYDLRMKMARVYNGIEWYNYEAKRVRDVAHVAETTFHPTSAREVRKYWDRLSHQLKVEESRVRRSIEELLVQNW